MGSDHLLASLGGMDVLGGALGRVLRDYPSLWPSAFALGLIPALVMASRSKAWVAFEQKHRHTLLMAWGLGCLALYLFCAGSYLRSPMFFDFFESSGASVSHWLFAGGEVYPALDYQERYCLPYGPVLYFVLGLSQWLLGASTFSSKLPCCLAALGAIALFWRILRQQGLSVSLACWVAGLEAAIILGLRETSFWTKSDPLILLLVTLSIWAALHRTWRWSLLLGLCMGLALGLKPSAAAYFLGPLVIAYSSGWRSRAFAGCGLALLAAAALPYLLLPRQISLSNHLNFLSIVAQVGFSQPFILGFSRWVAMLAGLLFVSDRLLRAQSAPNRAHRRESWAYRGALLCGVILVAIPACATGSGPHHLIPFVPLTLLACADLFRPGQKHFRPSESILWRAAACAILLACALVATQTAMRITHSRAEFDARARLCQQEISEICARHRQWTILTGSGNDLDRFALHFRHAVVFAGNPIGLDAAVVSDYQATGVPEPNLAGLLAEISRHDPRPVLWLIPRDSAPFTDSNWYHGRPNYSDTFRADFHARFARHEQTANFDLYFPIGTHARE
jgi:hypothetical protein